MIFSSKILARLKVLAKCYLIFAIFNVILKNLSLYFKRERVKALWKHLPGKECDFLATNLRKQGKDLHDYFMNNALEHSTADLIRQDTPNPSLICNSPRAIKWMLKEQFDIVTKPDKRSELFALMHEFLGDEGIFNLRHGKNCLKENDKWKKQRKVASLIFTQSNFKSLFYDTFVDKSKIFIRRLENEVKAENVVDLQKLFFSFTMDSIEKFFMGTEVNSIEGEMSEYGKAFDNAHRCMMEILTSNIGYYLISGLFLPYPLGMLWLNKENNSLFMKIVNHFDSNYQAFKRHIKVLDDHVYEYIQKTRNDPKVAQRKDIIANFLNSDIGNDLTDKTLRDIVLNLTIAGRDTTACALSWLFFELTQNLDVQDKLFLELDEKLKGNIPNFTDLQTNSLPYLHGCIYETLRLHPPVPTNTKSVTEDTTFLDGTIIPKDTELFYLPSAVGRNPTKFPSPGKFQPERWIPFEQKDLFDFPVFQAGPRFCLGKDMAQFEMKLLTIMLIQKFRFTLKPGEENKISYTLMLTQSISNNDKRSQMELLVYPSKRQ